MKLSNNDEVQFLIKTLRSLEGAAERCTQFMAAEHGNTAQHESLKEYAAGSFSLYLSKNRDGSGVGSNINLVGCYVEPELLEALAVIINDKIEYTKRELHVRGVTCE